MPWKTGTKNQAGHKHPHYLMTDCCDILDTSQPSWPQFPQLHSKPVSFPINRGVRGGFQCLRKNMEVVYLKLCCSLSSSSRKLHIKRQNTRNFLYLPWPGYKGSKWDREWADILEDTLIFLWQEQIPWSIYVNSPSWTSGSCNLNSHIWKEFQTFLRLSKRFGLGSRP